MPSLPTALLRHDTPAGSHYDWLLVNPRTADDPAARLWTARVHVPSDRWAALGAFEIEPIPPHRREYLGYEGPLARDEAGNDRGAVSRVDEGSFETIEWTGRRIVIDAEMRHFRGRLILELRTDGRWAARVSPNDPR